MMLNMEDLAASLCGMAQPGKDVAAMPSARAIEIANHNRNTKARLLPEPANEQSTVPAGFYQYQYQGSEGLTIDCHLEYEAAHYGGTGPNSDESYPESIELIYALVNGVDIAEVLSADVKKLIEEEALCNMEMDQWDSDYDAAEERALEREAA